MAERHAWDYVVHPVTNDPDTQSLQDALKDYGRVGWELVGVLDRESGSVLIFKRSMGDS